MGSSAIINHQPTSINAYSLKLRPLPAFGSSEAAAGTPHTAMEPRGFRRALELVDGAMESYEEACHSNTNNHHEEFPTPSFILLGLDLQELKD